MFTNHGALMIISSNLTRNLLNFLNNNFTLLDDELLQGQPYSKEEVIMETRFDPVTYFIMSIKEFKENITYNSSFLIVVKCCKYQLHCVIKNV